MESNTLTTLAAKEKLYYKYMVAVIVAGLTTTLQAHVDGPLSTTDSCVATSNSVAHQMVPLRGQCEGLCCSGATGTAQCAWAKFQWLAGGLGVVHSTTSGPWAKIHLWWGILICLPQRHTTGACVRHTVRNTGRTDAQLSGVPAGALR